MILHHFLPQRTNRVKITMQTCLSHLGPAEKKKYFENKDF